MGEVMKNGQKTARLKFDIKSMIYTVVFILTMFVIEAFAQNLDDSISDYTTIILILGIVILSCITVRYFYSLFFSAISSILAAYIRSNYTSDFWSLLMHLLPVIIGCMITSIVTCKMKELIIDREKVRLEIEKEKMRANLLRAISHDLRTPLTAISGSSEAVIDGMDTLNDEEKISFLCSIKNDSQWLIRMVENLLSITKITDDSAKLNKSDEIAEEVIMSAVQKFRKRFDTPMVKLEIPDDLIIVPMDPILIEQVITNLLENIVKHAKNADEAIVRLYSDGESAVFEIRDNGEGIPQSKIDSIFKGSFIQADSNNPDSTKNMGIGLSVCNSIISAHEGKIEAKNSTDGGAIFKFSLPYKKKESQNEQ